MAALPFMLPPLAIIALPFGYYGISYDIFTNATEHNLPNGWNSRRSGTYRKLIKRLRRSGYQRHQYSDYRTVLQKWAWQVWMDMWNLRYITPPMKFQTTVKGCKMQFYHYPHLFDISDAVQLGGAGAPGLVAKAPLGLIQAAQNRGRVLFPAPGPAPALPLPQGTRRSQNALDPNNWRQ